MDKETEWKMYDGKSSIPMVHGFELYLRPGCDYSKKRFLYNVAESNEIDFLKKVDFSGLNCLDIGANIGYWSAFLLTKNIYSLHAFEPDPVTFEILSKNIHNKGQRVYLNNVAVSKQSGSMQLYIDPNHSGDNRPVSTPGRNFITTPSVSIDDYCHNNNVEHVDFIKMDIQGGELDALLGGRTVIYKCQPIIFIEINDGGFGASKSQLIEFIVKLMSDLNHSAYSVFQDKLKNILPSELENFTGNLIINPKKSWI
jgi:FkbM family methyltransferase